MFGSFGIIVIVCRVAVHHWDYKIKKWLRLNVVLWNNYDRSDMSVRSLCRLLKLFLTSVFIVIESRSIRIKLRAARIVRSA